jgi:hypothetical protein
VTGTPSVPIVNVDPTVVPLLATANNWSGLNNMNQQIVTKPIPYTTTSADWGIVCDTATATGALTITLPLTPLTGAVQWFKNTGPFLCTISGNGKNIDGSPTYTGLATTGNAAGVQYDGTQWRIVFQPGGATPAGSGTELQYRNGANLGAVVGSSVSGGNVSIIGTASTNDAVKVSATAGFRAYSVWQIGDANPSFYNIGHNLWFGPGSAAVDTLFGRSGVGQFTIDGNGTRASLITTGTNQVGLYTVSSGTGQPALPICNSAAEGTSAGVVDLTAPTFMATLTGGGTVHGRVYCNGTAWISQ